MCASGARSPDAPTEPLRRHHRDDVLRQHRLQQLDRLAADAGGALRRGWRASAPSSAGDGAGIGSPTPAACDSTMLRCRVSRSVGRDAHAGQFAEAGVDAVDRLALARRSRRRPRRCLDLGAAGRVERAARAAIDGAPVGERRPLPGFRVERFGHCPLQMRGMQRVEAHAVDELGRALDVPDREVGTICRPPACRSRRAGRARGRPRG